MVTTRQIVAERIAAYLRHEIALMQLADWAEQTLMEGELDESDASMLASVIARLGLSDVHAFGLTWEDCEELLGRLGFSPRVEVIAV